MEAMQLRGWGIIKELGFTQQQWGAFKSSPDHENSMITWLLQKISLCVSTLGVD